MYPGLMVTSGIIYNFLHALNLPVDIRNVCVLLAPGFSALTAWATYMCVPYFKFNIWPVYEPSNQVHQRNEGRKCWAPCCSLHRHCSWIHFPFSSWLLRQRSYRNLPSHVHVLLLDQSLEARQCSFWNLGRPVLLLHGR